jgi:hypothetical protein
LQHSPDYKLLDLCCFSLPTNLFIYSSRPARNLQIPWAGSPLSKINWTVVLCSFVFRPPLALLLKMTESSPFVHIFLLPASRKRVKENHVPFA